MTGGIIESVVTIFISVGPKTGAGASSERKEMPFVVAIPTVIFSIEKTKKKTQEIPTYFGFQKIQRELVAIGFGSSDWL